MSLLTLILSQEIANEKANGKANEIANGKANQIANVDAEGAHAGKSSYIRYVVPTPDDEEATVEYDLDEEDEQWLQQHNRQVCNITKFQQPTEP